VDDSVCPHADYAFAGDLDVHDADGPFFVTNLATSLDDTQANEEQLSSELSSGVSVTSLSQNPVAAGQNVLLLNSIQQDDSFTQSSNLVQGQLQVADSALGSVVSQLTQALSLATSGNNGALNSSQLVSISNQLSGIRDEVVSLANTSYQGQYIFGGSKTSVTPFTVSNAASLGAPATTTYNGDEVVNHLQTPTGQTIQLNLPGDQIFPTSGANSALAALNNLIADFASGASVAASVQDTETLNTALNYISQQRVTLDNSLTRLTSASDAVTNESTQLTAAQTDLMQADIPQISTQLSLTETQQAALEDVISQLGSGSLFDKLT
jgi:flagellar hook-associated protein 3 FlgL